MPIESVVGVSWTVGIVVFLVVGGFASREKTFDRAMTTFSVAVLWPAAVLYWSGLRLFRLRQSWHQRRQRR